MQPTDRTKLIVGTALATGAALLTGDAVLASLASSIGGNWASEGLGTLWAAGTRVPLASGPLADAYGRAIRTAIAELRRQYAAEAGPLPAGNAFDLLRESAAAVGETQFPAGAVGILSTQRELEQGLAALLHGHDERQQAFIARNLLPAVAVAFRNQLASDPPAWQRFHGWLIETTAHNTAALQQVFAGVPELLARLQQIADQGQALDAAMTQLDELIAALRAAIARLAADAGTGPEVQFRNTGLEAGQDLRQVAGDLFAGTPPAALPTRPADEGQRRSVLFDNQNVKAKGNASQVAGDMYLADTPAAPPQREPVVVLAVFANPQDTAPLRWKQEERALRDCLDPLGTRFRLETRTSVSPDELHQALLRHRPQILHFSGHGEEAGLLFETRSGDRQLVPRAALITLLHHTPSLRCVVLNACHAAVHGEQTTLGAPYLIAMQGAIDDGTALAFAQGFYDALGAGHEIAAAFKAGCDRIAVNALPGAAVPKLVRRTMPA